MGGRLNGGLRQINFLDLEPLCMLADKPMWCFDPLRCRRQHPCLLSPFVEYYSCNAAMTGQAIYVLVCHSHKKLRCAGQSHRRGGYKLWELSEKYWFGDFCADLCKSALDNVRHMNREKVNMFPGFFFLNMGLTLQFCLQLYFSSHFPCCCYDCS